MRPKTSPAYSSSYRSTVASVSSQNNTENLEKNSTHKIKTKGDLLKELSNFLRKKFPTSPAPVFSSLHIVKLSDLYLNTDGTYDYGRLEKDIDEGKVKPTSKSDDFNSPSTDEEASTVSSKSNHTSNISKDQMSSTQKEREIVQKELYIWRILISLINQEQNLSLLNRNYTDEEVKELNKFYKMKTLSYLTQTYGNNVNFKQLKFILLNKLYVYNKNYLLNNENLMVLYNDFDKFNTGLVSLKLIVERMFKLYPFPLYAPGSSSNNNSSLSFFTTISSSNSKSLKNSSQKIHLIDPTNNVQPSYSINIRQNLGIDSTSSNLPHGILELNNNKSYMNQNSAPINFYIAGTGNVLNQSNFSGEVRPMRLTDDIVSDIDDSNCPNFTIEELEEIIYKKIQDYYIRSSNNERSKDKKLSSKDLFQLLLKISNRNNATKNEFILDSYCFRALLQRLNVPFKHDHISMLIKKYEEVGASSGSAAKISSSCIARPSSASSTNRRRNKEETERNRSLSFSSLKNINNVILKNFYNDNDAIPLPSSASGTNISSFSSSSELKLFQTLNYDRKINIYKLCIGLVERIDKIDYYFYNDKENDFEGKYTNNNDYDNIIIDYNDEELIKKENKLKENIYKKLKLTKIKIKPANKLILKKFFILLKNNIKKLLFREKSCESNLLLNSNNFLLYLMTEIRMKKFFRYRLHINFDDFPSEVHDKIRDSFSQNGLFDIRKIFLYAMTVNYDKDDNEISDDNEKDETNSYINEERNFYDDISPTVLLVNKSYQTNDLSKSFLGSTFSSSNKEREKENTSKNNQQLKNTTLKNNEEKSKSNQTVSFNETPHIFTDSNIHSSNSLKSLGLKINNGIKKPSDTLPEKETKTQSISDIYKNSTPFLPTTSVPTKVDITFNQPNQSVRPSSAGSRPSSASKSRRPSSASSTRASSSSSNLNNNNLSSLSSDQVAPTVVHAFSPTSKRPTSAPSIRSNRNLVVPESPESVKSEKQKKSQYSSSFNYVDPMSSVLRDRYRVTLAHSPTSHAAYGIHIKDFEKAKKERKRLHEKLIKKNKIKNLYYTDEGDDYY